MSPGLVIALMITGLLVLIVAGYYIHSALLLIGIVGIYLLDGQSVLQGLLGPASFQRVATYTLTPVPLFVLMAQFVLQAGVVQDLFYIANRASRNRRGVLGTMTIGVGAVLGAVSGSGTATAASLGQVAVPELRKVGFSGPLAGAVTAAAGSLSGIIPPSILLILFGVATETPIGDLFIGAVIPGVLIAVIYVIVMLLFLGRKGERNIGGRTSGAISSNAAEARPTLFQVSVSLVLGAFIVALIFGGIYSGFTTPTEAGAVGAFAAFLAAVVLGKVSMAFLRKALTETVKVTVMVMIIMIGAQVFSRFVSLSLIPRNLISLLEPLVVMPAVLLLIIALFYLILFMFLEGAAVILMSVPITVPLILATEVDLIWFGVFVGFLASVGTLTPPVGLSVYAAAGAAGLRSDDVFKYAFWMALAATVLVSMLMIWFPALATWLPGLGGG